MTYNPILSQYSASGSTEPAGDCKSITPSDSALADNGEPILTRGISFAVAGDLVIRTAASDRLVTLVGLAAGSIHSIRATHIMAATTAAGVTIYW